MARKTYTFIQLSKKSQQKLIEEYNCTVERTAPYDEIKEYYMTMADGEGGAGLYYRDGSEVDDIPF